MQTLDKIYYEQDGKTKAVMLSASAVVNNGMALDDILAGVQEEIQPGINPTQAFEQALNS
ncbi:MAG: hypothetical protein NC080_07450 [Paraprevotella sp.]|nr:hypothetical protein [Paraprevotella sp.]